MFASLSLLQKESTCLFFFKFCHLCSSLGHFLESKLLTSPFSGSSSIFSQRPHSIPDKLCWLCLAAGGHRHLTQCCVLCSRQCRRGWKSRWRWATRWGIQPTLALSGVYNPPALGRKWGVLPSLCYSTLFTLGAVALVAVWMRVNSVSTLPPTSPL